MPLASTPLFFWEGSKGVPLCSLPALSFLAHIPYSTMSHIRSNYTDIRADYRDALRHRRKTKAMLDIARAGLEAAERKHEMAELEVEDVLKRLLRCADRLVQPTVAPPRPKAIVQYTGMCVRCGVKVSGLAAGDLCRYCVDEVGTHKPALFRESRTVDPLPDTISISDSDAEEEEDEGEVELPATLSLSDVEEEELPATQLSDDEAAYDAETLALPDDEGGVECAQTDDIFFERAM